MANSIKYRIDGSGFFKKKNGRIYDMKGCFYYAA